MSPGPLRPGSIGVMGGTFDPIHVGHLAVAEEARDRLGLARILFVVAGQPPHKAPVDVSPVEHRLAMVALAIAGNDAFELSRLEVDRPGPSFSADTLADLDRRERGAGRTPDLTLILSAETFADLPSWHQPGQMLDLARVAVVPREGYPAPDPGWIARTFPGQEDRVDFLAGPRLGLSSTDLRARVRAGRSIRYLVPDAVAGYIVDHRLYRLGGRRP
ncbi:MAG TPA: nicotinate-nucleotide adenylyltransferase [Candidatus Limnocylindrales bacterium]|nr:nicotinate-nucleotide adenylyltransferase [Candidatus Limnocylindrales bacterium]